jgi:PTH1 family peptidyl-tRNA hydrolase
MPLENLVVAGLGNPGAEYSMTRHNMGYLIAQALAKTLGWTFKEESRFQAWVAKGTQDGTKVHILLPTTYMNLSGQAVRNYLDYLKLDSHSVLAVIDDIALPFGEMRLLASGGTGGHNGLKSLQQHLGTAVYKRLRVGIGGCQGQRLEDYVLGSFNAEERANLPNVLEGGVRVIQRLLKEEFADVMSSVNRRIRAETKKGPEHQGDKDESIKTQTKPL